MGARVLRQQRHKGDVAAEVFTRLQWMHLRQVLLLERLQHHLLDQPHLALHRLRLQVHGERFARLRILKRSSEALPADVVPMLEGLLEEVLEHGGIYLAGRLCFLV